MADLTHGTFPIKDVSEQERFAEEIHRANSWHVSKQKRFITRMARRRVTSHQHMAGFQTALSAAYQQWPT